MSTQLGGSDDHAALPDAKETVPDKVTPPPENVEGDAEMPTRAAPDDQSTCEIAEACVQVSTCETDAAADVTKEAVANFEKDAIDADVSQTGTSIVLEIQNGRVDFQGSARQKMEMVHSELEKLSQDMYRMESDHDAITCTDTARNASVIKSDLDAAFAQVQEVFVNEATLTAKYVVRD